MGLPERVLRRFLQADEFPSSKALQDYLREHPHADKSLHTVEKPDSQKPAEKQKPSKSVKPSAIGHAGLEQRLKDALKKLPKETHKFFTDEKSRKETLKSAVQKIKDSPKTLVASALKHAKKEADLYKSAGGAVKALLTGKKATPEQKDALHSVARTIAIQVTLVALTSGASGLVGKSAQGLATGIAKRIALNVLTADGLGDINSDLETLKDTFAVGKVTLGVLAEFFKSAADSDDKALDAMEIYGQLVAAKVAKKLDKLSLEDILDAVD